MTRRLLMVGMCSLVLAYAVLAGEKPDFSGQWKMNAEKTDFGMIPKPDKLERTIDHKDPTLKMTTTQVNQMGERTYEMVFTTDGKESANKQGPTDVKSVAKWDGSILVIKSKREVQGMEITSEDKWSLSEDGKTLTIDSNLTTPQGDIQLKVVMDKQSEAAKQ
jgi:hypothetical protein